jgi:hypothetical protein
VADQGSKIAMALPRGTGVSSKINRLEKGLGKTRCIELQCVSGSLPNPFSLIVACEVGGGFQIGWQDDPPSFPSRSFAEAVAGQITAAAKCAERWRDAGREVTIMETPPPRVWDQGSGDP